MDHQNFVDHYEILGVSRDATPEDMKKGYKKMSLKRHPDKNKSTDTATKAFQMVNRAYEILSNPEERRLYNIDYDQHVAWTRRGDKSKRKASNDDSDDSDDEEVRKAAARFINKRARTQYGEQERPVPETNARSCRTEEILGREYYRPKRPKLWTPYQHPDIRIVGDNVRWCW